tara:strand:- start:713 stop:1099 length:387 start_codon:yes stop_codon:yes gene_type:complete
MGCQTTNTTPNAVVEPAPQNTSEKQDDQKEELVEPQKILNTMKPIMCADTESVHKGLKISGEEPIVMWNDQTNGYAAALWYNDIKKTITVIEYAGENMGCFTSVGVNAHIKEGFQRNVGQIVKWRLDN